jgi:UDP-N-acetylmuramate--alanine ligase
MMNYFEALGQMVNPYYLIAVAGTHGKTTTTAMLIDVFEAAGKDPTGIVGSLRASTHSNYRPGKSKYAIVEACEYKQDFLSLKPDVLVITNVEHEHVDYYKDLAAVQAGFRALVSQVNEGGVVVTNPSDSTIAPIVADAPVAVIDYQAYFDLTLPMKQPGMHTRLNAAAALAVAKHEQLETEAARTALSNFAGTWRRFEFKGYCNGAPVYDDYGHHPTELMATMAGARELYPDRRLVVAFEPHTYSRTAALFEQFARAFAYADRVLLLPIYAAREENTWGVNSRELAVKALEFNQNVTAVQSMAEAEADLRASVKEADVVLIMGAGTITQLASDLTK